MIDNIASGINNEKDAYAFRYDGMLGLAPKIHPTQTFETFAQYLKRRKLISADTLSVEKVDSSTPKFKITLGKYNDTGAFKSNFDLRKQNGDDNMWGTRTTGIEIEGKSFKTESNSFAIFEVTRGIHSFTTQDKNRFNSTVQFFEKQILAITQNSADL